MDLAAVTAIACFDVFATPIHIDGTPARGIVSTELVELTGYEQVAEKRLTLAVLIDEVPELRKGQSVEVGGKTYRVDLPLGAKEDPDVLLKVLLR